MHVSAHTNTHAHECTHTHMHTNTHICTQTHTCLSNLHLNCNTFQHIFKAKASNKWQCSKMPSQRNKTSTNTRTHSCVLRLLWLIMVTVASGLLRIMWCCQDWWRSLRPRCSSNNRYTLYSYRFWYGCCVEWTHERWVMERNKIWFSHLLVWNL